MLEEIIRQRLIYKHVILLCSKNFRESRIKTIRCVKIDAVNPTTQLPLLLAQSCLCIARSLNDFEEIRGIC